MFAVTVAAAELAGAQGATGDPIRIALAPAAAGAAIGAPSDADRVAVRICRTSLADDSSMAAAVSVFSHVLPGLPWRAVVLAHFPTDFSAAAHSALVATPGEDPLLYWRSPLRAEELLHELVHGWQFALSDDALAAVLDRLAARDARGGFDSTVVEQATSSVVIGLSFADGRRGARTSELVERATTVSAGGAGALRGRSDALAALIKGSEWTRVRQALTHGLSARQANAQAPSDWTAWLRTLFLLEAQAYDAQARCSSGNSPHSWLTEIAPDASSAIMAASSGRRRVLDDPHE